MRLVGAMMIGPGELDRYLTVTVAALLEFCDAVVAVDESTDGSGDHASELGAMVERAEPGAFFRHEGQARQILIDVALEQRPTHVLVIDADELVTDGQRLRAACESGCPVLSLEMQEVWRVTESGLAIRQDGGWRAHPVPSVFRVDASPTWSIQDRALACGREPEQIRGLIARGCWEPSGTDLLHLGWANVGERQARYQRYADHDGGRFHAGAHLRSILDPDSRVRTTSRAWPESWPTDRREDLLERANLRDPASLTDEELLDELRSAEDPQEIVRLRAAAAQRGLWSGPAHMDPAERKRRREEGPAT